MFNHNINSHPQARSQPSRYTYVGGGEEALYYNATLDNHYPLSPQTQPMPLSYHQGLPPLPLPPSYDHPFGPQLGNFAFYQSSASTAPPPTAPQNEGQYYDQQWPNHLFTLAESSRPTAPTITPTPSLRAVGTLAISVAAHNRRDPNSNANFVCHLCQSSFTAKHNLEYHLRAHTNERPFRCDICPETAFTAKSDLARHVKKSKRHAAQLRSIQGVWMA